MEQFAHPPPPPLKKGLSHGREMALKSTNQSQVKETIHSVALMYGLLGARRHFLPRVCSRVG